MDGIIPVMLYKNYKNKACGMENMPLFIYYNKKI